MSLISNITISLDGDSSLRPYEKELRALILTPAGTMIGNRDFGISYDLVSMPPQQAANFLQMELEKKLPVYIPEIKSKGVTFTMDDDGKMVATIAIGKAAG